MDQMKNFSNQMLIILAMILNERAKAFNVRPPSWVSDLFNSGSLNEETIGGSIAVVDTALTENRRRSLLQLGKYPMHDLALTALWAWNAPPQQRALRSLCVISAIVFPAIIGIYDPPRALKCRYASQGLLDLWMRQTGIDKTKLIADGQSGSLTSLPINEQTSKAVADSVAEHFKRIRGGFDSDHIRLGDIGCMKPTKIIPSCTIRDLEEVYYKGFDVLGDEPSGLNLTYSSIFPSIFCFGKQTFLSRFAILTQIVIGIVTFNIPLCLLVCATSVDDILHLCEGSMQEKHEDIVIDAEFTFEYIDW